ncbi:MAG TPA: gamma-glutamylcyclotransferase [Burkholderiales bacterium]|nr:gamma-glutamylcyclotransferase [Burkholderiales bacterium]
MSSKSHPSSSTQPASQPVAPPFLCRADLEKNVLRQGLDECLNSHLLSEEELESTLREVLDSPERNGGDVWLFAYGSLVWNPVFEYESRHVATVHGFHRSMCLWSRINRGTPQSPGVVLGLDRGGRCTGVVYRIPAAIAEKELRLLWRREMLLGSYTPRWVHATRGNQSFRALAFVVNRDRSGYAGRIPSDRLVEILCQAKGKLGSALDYLRLTVDGLAANGIRDAQLLQLDALVRARQGEEEPQTPRAALHT